MPWTDEEGLLLACPVGGGRVFSERDAVCEELWRRVYRVLFTRTKGNVPLSTAATEALGDEAWTAGYAADTASSTWEMEQWTDADRDDPALI